MVAEVHVRANFHLINYDR